MMSHTFDQSEAEDVMVVNQVRRRKEMLALRCGVKLPVAFIKVLFDTNVMECWLCSSAPAGPLLPLQLAAIFTSSVHQISNAGTSSVYVRPLQAGPVSSLCV